MSYFVYLETIVNDRTKCRLSDDDDGFYTKVLSVDRIPEGGLQNHIKTVILKNVMFPIYSRC